MVRMAVQGQLDIISRLKCSIENNKNLLYNMNMNNDNLDKLRAMTQEVVAFETAEQKFKQIVELCMEGIWVVDENLVTTYVNPRMAEILETTVEDMIGKTADEYIGPDQKEMASIQKNLRNTGHDSKQYAFVYLSKKKNPVYALVAAKNLVDVNGKFKGSFGMVTDITELRKAEIQLKRFFTLSIDMFCIAGLDGYFKKLNPKWEEALGFTTNELLSRPYVDLVHPDDVKSTIQAANKLAMGGTLIDFENRYLTKRGEYIKLRWRATLYKNGESAFYAIATIIE